jgi:hypothetical protein
VHVEPLAIARLLPLTLVAPCVTVSDADEPQFVVLGR